MTFNDLDPSYPVFHRASPRFVSGSQPNSIPYPRFHTDRAEDEQFNDEKAYLIRQIRELKPLTDSPQTTPQHTANPVAGAPANSGGGSA